MEKAKKVSTKEDVVLVSILDYAGGTPIESVVNIDAKGCIEVSEEGTQKGLGAAKAYAKEIYGGFDKFLK